MRLPGWRGEYLGFLDHDDLWGPLPGEYQFTGGIEIRESGDLAAPLTLGILRPCRRPGGFVYGFV
jgi:hypothetical protein